MATHVANRFSIAQRSLSLICQTPIRPQVPIYLIPFIANRPASQKSKTAKSSAKTAKAKEAPKKKKARTEYIRQPLNDMDRFALCDAMRYIRAFEVGRNPTSSKYELAVSLKSVKNGPVVRNRLRLPHAVDTSQRICVICPPNSKISEAAVKAGATVVGEDTVFDAVKAGRIEFDRCIAHPESVQKLGKSGIARVLGPRGLMPNAKTGTVVSDVASSVKEMRGGSEYREKVGVVRMAVGQLGFTPEEMQSNIRVYMDALKRDIAQLSDRVAKDIHEVVLSSTNSPGFSLSGDFRSPTSVTTRELSVL
ncbi:mitochondrial 54S ribosomal protein mrpl1 [Agyrium rufum]|nr:mitochondrial 54S ribosomal protein mrpl1 [Agyrium rufum]